MTTAATPDPSAVAYRELHPDDIIRALESKGYEPDGGLLALNSYENRVYRVNLRAGPPVVAKFYRPGRWSDAAIHEEHEFAIALASAEVPVLAPLPDADGVTLFEYAGFRFCLYEYRAGRAPELDNLPLLEQLGRLVARIHLVGELSPFRHRPTITPDSFGQASHDWLLDNDCIPADLLPAYRSLWRDLDPAIEECYARAGHPRHLRLHGDFHPGNVLLAGEQLYIVDLDDARSGPAVQDLWMFLSGDRHEQEPQLAALLTGYTRFHHFDARQLHLVEALRTLRIMHYAAWLARRQDDPAFRQAFPWFGDRRYWDEHILALREQLALMQEPPLVWSAD